MCGVPLYNFRARMMKMLVVSNKSLKKGGVRLKRFDGRVHIAFVVLKILTLLVMRKSASCPLSFTDEIV